MINIQPIEKLSLGDGQSLSVHSIFYTIQGEGPFSGHPAVFIRLAGCNLMCPACDTQYTEGRTIMPIAEICEKICSIILDGVLDWPLVVITGGEPFRQNLTPLLEDLGKSRMTVQIETNGTLPPSVGLPDKVVIVCSPKTAKLNPMIVNRIDYFKYVLSYASVDPDDGLPVLALGNGRERIARPPFAFNKPIYLQPMDPNSTENEYNKNLNAVIKSCMKFGHILQLQIHKLVGVE